jgi:hypothetical protein
MMGVTLYHLVYRKPITKGKNTPKNFKIEDNNIEASLRNLLNRLLDEDPDKRYTMHELKVISIIT